MAYNYPSSIPNAKIQLRSPEPSRFPQENIPSNFEKYTRRNYSSEQQIYYAAQPGVPLVRAQQNISGPQYISPSPAPVSHPNTQVQIPFDSHLLHSNFEKETQISNLKGTIKSQQDTINLLERERDLLSNRLHIVQSRLEPHSKWNPKYIPELDRMISELKHSINPSTTTPHLNSILQHCENVSIVLNKIFSGPNLHASAPSIHNLQIANYPASQRLPTPQPIQSITPQVQQYPDPSQLAPRAQHAQNLSPHPFGNK